jgi:hypothetical protein
MCETRFNNAICADMATRSLLDQGIDSKHRAALLESHGFLSPESIETLQTRTPKFNWMIHPEWVQRYVSYLFICASTFM